MLTQLLREESHPCFPPAVQGEDTMSQPWNANYVTADFLGEKEIWFFVTVLFTADLVWTLVLRPSLMSCRLELSCWSMLALWLHESIAFLRSHYHMRNLPRFLKNGPEACLLKLWNMSLPHPPTPQKRKWQTVTDHWKIGMLQQQEVRSKAEILLFVKWSEIMGWKCARKRKANMKQEDRNHISSQQGDK